MALNENLSIITITNNSYKRLTDNSIASLRRLCDDISLNIYCMDGVSFNEYQKSSYSTRKLDYELHIHSKWGDRNWSNVTKQKLVAIHKELLDQNPFVLMFDGDIVFNDMKAILEPYQLMMNDQCIDLICQNEYHDGIKQELNSGFMLIRNNELTRDAFDPGKYLNNKKYKHDQAYVNSLRNKLKIHVLDDEHYPNGKYFYGKKTLIPYMVHFNYIFFEKKESKMKSYKMWFLE